MSESPLSFGGPGSGQPIPALEHASRQMLKATHVPLAVPTPPTGGALAKAAYVRQLSLQSGDVAKVRTHLATETRAAEADGLTVQRPTLAENPLLDLLERFESPALAALSPKAAEFADAPTAALAGFANALTAVRAQAAKATTDPAAVILLNKAATAAAALDTFAHPIGMLNLERLEMAPAGIERGELIATIPLAPAEETSVTQKEWSVTTKEFTSIVTDSLENFSETGVTDNTELTQSVTSQAQHANQFNVTGTVSGGIGVVSGSVTTSYGSQDAQSTSASTSRKHAQSLTQKASSRAKQEHKVTISTTTVTGSSESTTRTLKNPSTVEPMRIDYFSMMRKWRVRLYRYGLRLTYDIVVPEPGAALRRVHAQIAELKSQLGPFVFPVSHSEIVDQIVPGDPQPPAPFPPQPHYKVLADRYGAKVADAPAQVPPFVVSATVSGFSGDKNSVNDFQLQLNIPAGQAVDTLTFSGFVTGPTGLGLDIAIIGTTFFKTNQPDSNYPPTLLVDAGTNQPYLRGATGQQQLGFYFQQTTSAQIQIMVATKPDAEAIARWQADVWNVLYDAAQTQYYAKQQEISDQITALEASLSAIDTLTLRREENDELMKQVLRFMLGVGFEFMPDPVRAAFQAAGADLAHGIEPDNDSLGLSAADWTTLMQHEDVVKFVNEAIEWENVVSYLYSYFWDLPDSWDFIRQIKHPDPNRQAFLRAGSARVVLTVRKGWEEAWVRYAEGGFQNAQIDPNHPYLTIAQEIAAYDDRNYPGIPAANPAAVSVRLEDSVATTCSSALAASATPVTVRVASSAGFTAGQPVVIDVAGTPDAQESQMVVDVPDPEHLVLALLDHAHDGSATPFPIVQPGTKGTLIAEWNEYTPTSGTDIAVTSDLTTIA